MTIPAQRPQPAEAGLTLGGYELVRRIGRGGMAEVWVARRAVGRKGTKYVALKLLADHYVGDERYSRMFRSEAELAAILSHANIVQVFDEGEDNGRSYLIMEWVDGLNLLKLGAVLALLDDEHRRFRVTSYIIGQLLYALKYAHSITSFDGNPLGVVHRDVSPQNVLVSNHGEVKLTDFGVAYYAMEESSGIHVKGKVRYMSPEQLGGKTRLPTVDLFAVGALLHELLDGKKFRNDYEDGQEMFTAVLAGTVPPLTRDVPAELDELRLRLLQPDPGQRIQSAEEALDWLKQYPGHGDAREDLTQLCSSLTGVVRPRAGPGRSSPVPSADHRTAKFQGKLAKPRVAPGHLQPGSPPPSSPSSSVARTNSTTAVKSPTSRAGGPSAVITGDTDFVAPQGPQRPAHKRIFGAPAPVAATPPPFHGASPTQPNEPARVNGRGNGAAGHPRGPVGSPAQPRRATVGYPGGRAVAASNSQPARAGGQAAPVIPPPPAFHGHMLAEPAPAVPLPVGPRAASPAPHLVEPQPSQPIATEMGSQGGAVPPTERLVSSEASSSGGPGGTQVIDPNMIIEITGDSGTDQDIVQPLALREGTDTSREIRPRTPSQSHTISIQLPSRSTTALIVVGLLLVAVMSVGITWWIVTHNRTVEPMASAAAQEQEPSGESPGSSAPPEMKAVGAEPGGAGSVGAVEAVEGSPDQVEDTLEFPKEDVPALLGPPDADGADPAAEDPELGPPDADVEAEAGPVPQTDPEASVPAEEPPPVVSEDPPVVPDEPEPVKKPPPKPKATLVIQAMKPFAGSQLKIGSKTLTLQGGSVTLRFRAGTK
ncbi:MAG: protein kinase, partial [Deltaproteobacteria bacterium]|nr:protein kinase [Deltaproteobacteria bacterium]